MPLSAAQSFQMLACARDIGHQAAKILLTSQRAREICHRPRQDFIRVVSQPVTRVRMWHSGSSVAMVIASHWGRLLRFPILTRLAHHPNHVVSHTVNGSKPVGGGDRVVTGGKDKSKRSTVALEFQSIFK